MNTTQENITKALQTSALLLADLRDAYEAASAGTIEYMLADAIEHAQVSSRILMSIHDATKEPGHE